MLPKLSLNKSDKYQIVVATSYVAVMLESFIQGKKHFIDLGCEQGDIPTWDDLVIKKSEGVFEHVQVKRQTTPFCNSKVIRARKRGSKTGEFQKRSKLDVPMLGLANWVKENYDDAVNKKRSFIIELPTASVRIKVGKKINNKGVEEEVDFEVRDFKEVWEQFNNYTTVAGLEEKRKSCSKTNNFYLWLTHWCGFKSWDHILKAMLLLRIADSGHEYDINKRIEGGLESYFINGEMVREKIQGCIYENSDFSSSFAPRILLQSLKCDLRPDIATWTQYKNTKNESWSVTGTNDIRDRFRIEKPSQVVKNLWVEGGNRQLKIAASAHCGFNNQLPQSLVHLALHLPKLSVAYFDDSKAWEAMTRDKLFTLGCSESDLDSDQLSWLENVDDLVSSEEEYPLTRSRERAQQAEALTKEMFEHTWDAVCKNLEKKNVTLGDTALRDAVENRWVIWSDYLNENTLDRDNLFKKMLHPACEGEEVNASLRVGLKTANILADGLKMLLIVSVALDRDNDLWSPSADKIQLLALGYWSGLAGKKRQVGHIEDMARDILGREPLPTLLLSSVRSSPEQIYEDTIASDSVTQNNLSAMHQPDLLVTNNTRFRNLIQSGDIDEIKKYLEGGQRFNKASQEASIKRAARL